MIPSLYDQDILLWVEDTVSKLKTQDFEHLDLVNLIEEVESLGASQKRELLNRLIVLLEHLLKRIYLPMPENYRGWENRIREQRRQLRLLLEDVPSLKTIWDNNFQRAWLLALQDVRDEYSRVNFPDSCPFSSNLTVILNDRFWENQEISQKNIFTININD